MRSLADQLLEALLAEGAGEELTKRIKALLRSFDYADANELGVWFKTTFPAVFGSRTPRGFKDLKLDAVWLHRFLENTFMPMGDLAVVDTAEVRAARAKELGQRWDRVKSNVPELVRVFSNEDKAEGKQVPAELSLGGVTYINGIGFTALKLKKWAGEMNKLWSSVKGWRHKAVTAGGGLKVKFARPQEFRGTAAGVYRTQADILLVRATPNILKRAGGTYGAPDYILVHELGHRYEAKVGPGKGVSPTTKYSFKEGEAFAELFALGHFGASIKRTGPVPDLEGKLARFEKAMGGGGRVQENDIAHLHLAWKGKKMAKALVKGKGDKGMPQPVGAGRAKGYRQMTHHKT